MRFLNIIGTSVFQIISFIFVLGYLLGILNIHFSDRNDFCLMTFMFEYPQFVKITVPEDSLYPQYGLYAYSEGRLTERARKMWFDGVPVLFLPGNSGSYMQARSLASVALRKALSNGYEYHFDFFTISYNEELSGLYGGVLQSQTKYAATCISKILSLYKSNKYTRTVPTSVILIGHSMGGVIAKRLLAYPSTINTANVAITLASPLQSPVINVDVTMNDFYKLIDFEWEAFVDKHEDVRRKKVLLSLGSGPRDLLLPSGLTSSNESYIGSLTTAIPGVWVSPDHVGIVWCKQLVMTINKYLFSVIDPATEQITENPDLLKEKARRFFQANRQMTLNPDNNRTTMPMLVDAFWYEDNRRIYQISRPEIQKTTYLMIRLMNFPQNRFVAIEAVNIDDNEMLFGCNTNLVHGTYRYCKQATSLTELTRWTGAATDFGKRKLATINLHKLKELYPEWSHAIVRVPPTRKPVVLNVDTNDLASRQITVNLPSVLSFGRYIIKEETVPDSLYYELLLPHFNSIHQAYLLYIEPTASCRAVQYHVSVEMYVPWAENHETYHYFTQAKLSPMKLRLFKSSPNNTLGLDTTEHVKLTVLLDPQCTYTISISSTWYHSLAQLVRNYSPVLIPYVAAIVLLATRSIILSLKDNGSCMSIHSALMSEGVKPYYALVFGRLAAMLFATVPILTMLFENASYKNPEIIYFTRSLLVVPAYMTALGLVNIAAAAVDAVMVFSSQLAHRLLLRIVWRGGTGLAEKVASGLQKVPMVVSATLICAAPLSCGAASLVAGAAFYAFMLSKMYEEYLEDYVYKIMAKMAAKMCRLFTKNKTTAESEISRIQRTDQISCNESTPVIDDNKSNIVSNVDNKIDNEPVTNTKAILSSENYNEIKSINTRKKRRSKRRRSGNNEGDDDDELNNLNFHMVLFFLWMSVTLVNIPALLTWARNFKYSMTLKPDTSYHAGLALSVCSSYIWQMDGPRKKLRYYEPVSSLLFTMAVFILALGPQALSVVNYGMTFMFIVITVQQILDKDDTKPELDTLKSDDTNKPNNDDTKETDTNEGNIDDKQNATENSSDNEKTKKEEERESQPSETDKNECDVCSESRIYNIFKNLREKFSFNEEL